MNIRRIAFLLLMECLLVASLSAQAGVQQATLVIPEELNILSIDNKSHTDRLFSSGDTTLKLEPGQHRIVVEYDVFWDISSDEHERIQSKSFQITFSAEPAKQYYIRLPSFNQLEEAQEYANKPAFELIDRSTNQRVAVEVIYHEVYRSLLNGFSQPAVTPRSVQDPLPATPVVAVPVANTASSKPSSGLNATPLKMLEYWWGQANAQQRKQFIESRQQ